MTTGPSHPLLRMTEDDLAMICTFVLASGSIKELAGTYGVSYPTMRTRLDQLITRLQAAVDDRPLDPLNDYLANLIAKGQLSAAVARRIRALHEDSQRAGENRDAPPRET